MARVILVADWCYADRAMVTEPQDTCTCDGVLTQARRTGMMSLIVGEVVEHLRMGRVVVIVGDLLYLEVEKACQAAGVSTDGLCRPDPRTVH